MAFNNLRLVIILLFIHLFITISADIKVFEIVNGL